LHSIHAVREVQKSKGGGADVIGTVVAAAVVGTAVVGTAVVGTAVVAADDDSISGHRAHVELSQQGKKLATADENSANMAASCRQTAPPPRLACDHRSQQKCGRGKGWHLGALAVHVADADDGNGGAGRHGPFAAASLRWRQAAG
jgi:hypothetical protein